MSSRPQTWWSWTAEQLTSRQTAQTARTRNNARQTSWRTSAMIAVTRHTFSQATHTQRLIHKHYTHLFRSIAYTDHCLHYLLPEKRNRSMNLRHRGHEYTLSHIRTTQLKNTFINRCLFSMVYSSLCFIVCLQWRIDIWHSHYLCVLLGVLALNTWRFAFLTL